MKKSLLALAVLGAFAGAASAQSSVTLFGIVDTSVANISNKTSAGVKTTTQQMINDGINSSRLGFRGVEDLGGGLKAGFWLEAGLAPDAGGQGGSNGVTTVTFNRRSTVSLLGGFGEVRLGRDYTPSFWNLTVFDPFGTNGVGALTNVISTLGSGAITLVRDNNTVGYFLPSGIGGLYGQVQTAAGEGVNGQKYTGARVGYAAGPVDVAAGFGKTETGVNDYKLFNLGGAFTFGPAKLTAQYVQGKFGSAKQVVWQLGAVVAMGQGELHAAYDRADMKGTGIDNNDANQIALGYVYNLSKRTALYGTGSRIKNKGASAFVVSGPGSAAGGTSTGLQAGIRHSF